MWKRIRANKAGFTLFQMILVLFIIAALAAVSMVYGQRTQEELKVEIAVRDLLSRYEYYQKRAILSGQGTTVDFYERDVTFGRSRFQAADRVVLPDGASFANTPTLYISGGSGALTNFETVRIRYPGGCYEIRFQLGAGQYVVEKKKPV